MSTTHAPSATRTPALTAPEQINIVLSFAGSFAVMLIVLIGLPDKTTWTNTLAVIAAISAISGVLLASEIRRKPHDLPRAVAITGYALTALAPLAMTLYGIIAAISPSI